SENYSVAAANVGIDSGNGRCPDCSEGKQKLNANMPRAVIPRSGNELPEEQKRNAGNKGNQHGVSNVTLRKQVLKNVPGILASKMENAVLIEPKKCIAERRGPDRKIIPDF